MYLRTRQGFGSVMAGSDLMRMRTGPARCTGYVTGELRISRTSKGHLAPDVSLLDGRLLVADFGVGRSNVKSSTQAEKLLKDWLKRFESDPTYRLRILGYSDCVGLEKSNQTVRKNRAQQVYQLLGKSARSRVVSVGAAPLGTYVPGTGNTTVEGRAKNRSAIIEFWQEDQTRKSTGRPRLDLPKSVKERIEKGGQGPMEIERQRRQAQKKFWEPVPAPRRKSLQDQIRHRLRAEGVPDRVIDELFRTAGPAGRFAANIALNDMQISEAAKEFVRDRLKVIYSWRF